MLKGLPFCLLFLYNFIILKKGKKKGKEEAMLICLCTVSVPPNKTGMTAYMNPKILQMKP